MGIMSTHTRVITRTINPYPIAYLVYRGNLWLILSCSLYSLATVGSIPEELRDRQVELAYFGDVMLFGGRKLGLVVSP